MATGEQFAASTCSQRLAMFLLKQIKVCLQTRLAGAFPPTKQDVALHITLSSKYFQSSQMTI
jgi:hypothetical protein